MNKSVLFSISILLMISFSTGIFVEIVTPDHAAISTELPSFWESLWQNFKNDFFTVCVAAFFSFTVYLTPCVAILILCKTFSLGFSSAFLLSSPEHGLDILLALLLPRAMLKVPAYILLFVISIDTARQIKTNRQKYAQRKSLLFYILKRKALCFLALLISSLTEVVLMQVML